MEITGGRFRAALLVGAAASLLAFTAGAMAQDKPKDNTWPYAETGKSPVLAVVGDVSCQPGAEVTGESGNEVCTDPAPTNPSPAYTSTSLWQSQEATANQIENMKPDAVALLGDLQYQVGRYSDFEGSFDLTYGAFKFLHRPSPGNHEFYNEHGEMGVRGYGYFSYYNGFMINANGSIPTTPIPNPCVTTSASCKAAGKTAVPEMQPVPRADGQAGHFELGANAGLNGSGIGDGWYSYNLGSWHLISLNIQCFTQPAPLLSDGCSDTSTWLASELAWLKKDLEENHAPCTAAYWHQPLFSAANSLSEEGTTSKAFWQLLYEHHADLVLNGHDHLYARYKHLDPNGNPNPEGIREFIVGTGGETLDAVATTGTTSDPSGNANFNTQNLEKASGDFWGVMALTLEPHGYKWDFEPALDLPGDSAASFNDKGSATCHGSPYRDRDDDDRDHDRDHDHDNDHDNDHDR
jgi:acid phosphatase type 7